MQWRLVEGVPQEEVQRLLSIARRRRFARNEVVFHRDDPADSLHLISRGRFAIRIMTPLGDTATIGVRGAGESFGEMALVGVDARRSATVAALEDAETFAVYQTDFARLRREHPSVNDLLFAFLAEEIRRQNKLLLDALYVPAERRLLRRLVELVGIYGEETREIPLTQEALAEVAGISRATVNAVLRREEQRGTISLRRGRTTVLDLEALQRRAR